MCPHRSTLQAPREVLIRKAGLRMAQFRQAPKAIRKSTRKVLLFMKSPMFQFFKQVFRCSAALALVGLVGIAGALRADTVMCATAAQQGGDGSGTFTNVAGQAPCANAVKMSIPEPSGYAKLTWAPGDGGYSAGWTLGSLVSLNATVSGVVGGNPFYMLAFTDLGDSFLNTTSGDQILMIEFQNSTVSGNNMALNVNTTQFNLYDNTLGVYLESGQSDTNSLAGWIADDASLSSDSLQQIRIGLGMAPGAGPAESVTVNSLDVNAPEPTSLLLLVTLIAAAGLGMRLTQLGNRRS